MLMKIHEFAEFCGLSVRTLHLYDKMGLFYPEKTDDNNGYRYYGSEQMSELNTIISFRKVGISLKDIKDIKASNFSNEIIVQKLLRKRTDNLNLIEIVTYNNEIIDNILKQLSASQANNNVPNTEAKDLSKIVRLENDKLEHDFSQILWL